MDWWYYSTTPKTVKGGIKAQSRRGSFGQSWWAGRWNSVLEEYDIGERISRGRTYARKGQVESLKIHQGKITAVIYGSYKYSVTITIASIDDSHWRRVADRIFSQPVTVAKLLAGQMPDDIEHIFSNLGLRLFPAKEDIETDCDCPDWSNPCKHIVAVYLLLAEEFDRDPFMIFKLRGMDRRKLMGFVGLNTRAGKVRKDRKDKKRRIQSSTKKPRANLRLADPASFWGNAMPRIPENDVNATIPKVDAVLVKQLGNFPFWRSHEQFLPAMAAIYHNASVRGADIFLSKSVDNSDNA